MSAPAAKKNTAEPAAAPTELVFLVVDDDPLVIDTIREYLASFGAKSVLTAANGHEGLKIIQEQKVDFVISDWEMPSLGGLELLKLIRGNLKGGDAAVGNLPFIMITSPISHERMKVEEAALAEVDAYIVKPFRSQVLKDKITDVLQTKKSKSRRGALVVDDDRAVRESVAEILTSQGFSPVLEAEHGERALSLLSDHADLVGLVVSDWEMPGMAGIELLRAIRLDPKLSSIPFLMITSQTSIEHMKLKRAIESDVDHYLFKPFTVQALKDKVSLVLRKALREAELKRTIAHAVSAFEDGSLVDAERYYRKVLKLDPKSLDGLLGMARVHMACAPKHRYDEAYEIIQKAIRLHPKSPRGHVELARLLESTMSLEKAIQVLHAAQAVCQPSAELFHMLGKLLIRRGRGDEGIRELRKALELDPGLEDVEELLRSLNPEPDEA